MNDTMSDTMSDTLPKTMTAVLLTGHGGFDRLEFRQDVPIPDPEPDEVLIRVLACGVNNTDINTRIGWYSKSVTTQTSENAQKGIKTLEDDEGSWSGRPLDFPLIQGADICGKIVKVGKQVDPARIGERVIVAAMQPAPSSIPWACVTMGSEINGGFAQYAAVRSNTAYKVTSDWTDVELASIPCAWSTAENLLHRSKVTCQDKVLITGGSGGVGSAAIQLARRRGAHVTAVAGLSKVQQVLDLGADHVIPRDENLVKALGRETMDVVLDLVAGPKWPQLIEVLKAGGRYAVSGAIAGPMVELDVRTLYLKDLTFLGCTFQEPQVFENLVSYIENNEIQPIVAKAYPLDSIVQAQKDFLAKKHIGKLVLVLPTV
jgi:NADPH:quinone reductase-like Zn-dependent oxidoreductase